MKKCSLLLSCGLAVTAFVFLPTLASAQTVTATYETPNFLDIKYRLSTDTTNDDPNFTYEVDDTAGAGMFYFTQTDPVNPDMPTTFTGFCVELTEYSESPNTYDILSTNALVDPNVGGQIAWLYNTYATTSLSSLEAAALQVAIWEIRYDGGDNTLGDGNFLVYDDLNNGDLYIKATEYLDSIGNNRSEGIYLKSEGKQDFVTSNRVPEPGVLALLAAGLPLLGIARRRK